MGDEAVAIPEVLIGFPPIIAPDTHTLVLGSFPSKASLATSQYYGHPKNHFWQLMDWMFEPVHRKDAYETRLGALLSCGVGLWDVFYSCERAGSMDVDIRNATFNDFASLSKLAPHLKRVVFNGRVAARGLKFISQCGYRTYILPSTSPAYTIPIFNKFCIWKEVMMPPQSFEPKLLVREERD